MKLRTPHLTLLYEVIISNYYYPSNSKITHAHSSWPSLPGEKLREVFNHLATNWRDKCSHAIWYQFIFEIMLTIIGEIKEREYYLLRK